MKKTIDDKFLVSRGMIAGLRAEIAQYRNEINHSFTADPESPMSYHVRRLKYELNNLRELARRCVVDRRLYCRNYERR